MSSGALGRGQKRSQVTSGRETSRGCGMEDREGAGKLRATSALAGSEA